MIIYRENNSCKLYKPREPDIVKIKERERGGEILFWKWLKKDKQLSKIKGMKCKSDE